MHLDDGAVQRQRRVRRDKHWGVNQGETGGGGLERREGVARPFQAAALRFRPGPPGVGGRSGNTLSRVGGERRGARSPHHRSPEEAFHDPTHTIDVAAAKTGFSRATGYRLAEDPSFPSGKAAPRGRRRPDPLADIFETEVVPILENSPGIRSVGVFEALMQRHPDLDPGVRQHSGAADPRLAGRARSQSGR